MPADPAERLKKRTRPAASGSDSPRSSGAKNITPMREVPFVKFRDAEDGLRISIEILGSYFTFPRKTHDAEKVSELRTALALAAKTCKWAVETLIGADIEDFD
jgi:hypothetical protein